MWSAGSRHNLRNCRASTLPNPFPGMASPQITAAPSASVIWLIGADPWAAQTAWKSPLAQDDVFSPSTGARSGVITSTNRARRLASGSTMMTKLAMTIGQRVPGFFGVAIAIQELPVVVHQCRGVFHRRRIGVGEEVARSEEHTSELQ